MYHSRETKIRMKYLGICFSAALVLASSSAAIPDFEEKYILQPIDHYNFQSIKQAKYLQRYLISDKYWKANGPIFFYTGNEGPIEDIIKGAGFLMEHAPSFAALVVFAEHRYYGKSLPFGNDSLNGENVGYLSISQALSDYSYLAANLKRLYCNDTCPLFAFGASYGGVLAAYFRFKYPNIVDGALSSSAPMFSIAGYGNRNAFFESVTEQFMRVDKRCVDKIRQGFQEIASLASAGKYDTITVKASVCSNVTAANIEKLYGWIRTAYTILAMWNFPYESSIVGKLPAHPVKVACQHIRSSKDSLHSVILGASQFYNATYEGPQRCYDFENQYFPCSDPTGCGPGEHGQAWDYQCCTEMIMPGGSNNVTDMFPLMPFTLQERERFCYDKWKVMPRNEWDKIQFWGKNISSATNVIFTNGNLDPWSIGGVRHSTSSDVIIFEIQGGAHHLDMRSSHPEDPLSVKEVRNAEITILKRWINKASYESVL